jgi:hypothetical protein
VIDRTFRPGPASAAVPSEGRYGFCPRPSARCNAHMFKQGEYEPGPAVPITGRYELCHVLGRRTG